ncbi:MAG TPA: LysM peptidoglycan-binding domain-containing protein [Longimicrobium sp.]
MRTTASVVAAAALLSAAPLAAQDEPAQPAQVHVVRPGETLWDIARACLADPFLWPEIFRLNAGTVEDPALIYPSERLVLPACAGVRTGEGPFFGPPEQAPQGPTLRLGVTVERPAVLQGDFYRAAFMAQPREVPLVGRLEEAEYESVVAASPRTQFNLYDRVFVRVDPARVAVGDRLHFLREGREIRRTGRRVYLPTGVGTVAAMDGATATVVIVGMFDQVRIGDAAIRPETFPIRTLERPAPVDADLQGRVLAFRDDTPLQRTESILFLDIGRSAGVGVGDEFELYDPSTERRWGTRPEIFVARMQVVKVTEGTASVRVTHLEQPRITVGLPVRRVARMP